VRIGLQSAALLLPLAADVAANQILNAGVWNIPWTLSAIVITAAGAGMKHLSSRTAAQRDHPGATTLGAALQRAVERTEAVAARMESAAGRTADDRDDPRRTDDERATGIRRRGAPGSAHETAVLSLLWRVQDLPSPPPVDNDPADPRCSPPPRATLVLLGAAGAALAVLGTCLWLRWGSAPSIVAFTNQAIGVLFVAGAIVAWRIKPSLTAGFWMGTMGLLMLVSNLSVGLRLAADMPGDRAAVVLGNTAQWILLAVGGRLLMDLSIPAGSPKHFQARSLTRSAWALATISSLLLPAAEASAAPCYKWCGAGALQLSLNPALYLAVKSIVLLAWTALALAACRLVVRGRSLATERGRRLQRFTAMSGTTVLLLFALKNTGILAELAGGPDPAIRRLWSLLGLVTGPAGVIAAPAAFMIAFFGRQAMLAALAHLLGYRRPLPLTALQGALRIAVRDRTLLLLSPIDFGILVSADGQAFTRPPQHQHLTVLGHPPIAAMLHDVSLRDDPQLLTATARVALLALTTKDT